MNLNEIKSSDWQLSVNPDGAVVEGAADINQSIHLVLTTERGSDPLRPDYGINIEPLDRPVSVAAPEIIRQAVDAIRRWEPRVILDRVNAAIEGGQITITIRWRDARSAATGETSLTL